MTELILVGLIEPNKWNPNVMQDLEYQALKEDMKLNGPKGVDAILVSPWACFYPGVDVSEKCVIVDGEHRWRAAQELGWKEILCEAREITEDEAKGICYRRNRERGNIDPFKEAALFRSEVDLKHSQQEIAEKYLVDRSTVSHRLSLLKLDDHVLKAVSSVPRGTFTPSHLEPIASLQPPDQKLVVNDMMQHLKWSEQVSVKRISDEVNRIKEQREKETQLAKASETAKFPKCPKCGKKPDDIDHKGLPWVECESSNWDHVWNLETGRSLYHEERIQQNRLSGKPEVRLSSVLRSAHTVKELAAVFGDRIKEIIPKMDSILTIRVSGRLENAHFNFDLHFYGHSMGVYVRYGGRDESFSAEEHDYRSGEKSAVHCGRPEDIEKVKAFIEAAFQGKLGIEPKKRSKKEASAT